MYRVHVLPEADRDFDQNYLWIAKRSREGAANWYRRLLEVLDTLNSRPMSYGLAPESAVVGRDIRHINFKTRRGRLYRLLFEIRANDVFVLHLRGPGQRLTDDALAVQLEFDFAYSYPRPRCPNR